MNNVLQISDTDQSDVRRGVEINRAYYVLTTCKSRNKRRRQAQMLREIVDGRSESQATTKK